MVRTAFSRRVAIERSLIVASGTDYPAGRLLRDSRLYTVGAGTQEIRRMLIGRGFNEAYDEAKGKGMMQ